MDVFEKQLQLGCQLKKPVILHIKGMEKEALPLLKKYENCYVSHWYSCMDHLEEYDEVIDYALELGVTNGFIQEGETSEESFIPEFDFSGIL